MMKVKKISHNFQVEIFDYLVSNVMEIEINDQGQLVLRERIDMSQGDVILRCEDGSVPCHKVVLAALSPMLETILREVTGEEPPTIILPDIKLRTLTTFLTEFYVNSVSEVNTEITKLLGFKLRDHAEIPQNLTSIKIMKEKSDEFYNRPLKEVGKSIVDPRVKMRPIAPTGKKKFNNLRKIENESDITLKHQLISRMN